MSNLRLSIGWNLGLLLYTLGVFASPFILLSVTHVQGQTITYNTIALTGNAAPGTNTNFSSYFSAPVINDAGQTAFLAGLAGTGTGVIDEGSPFANDNGIFAGDNNALRLVARAGGVAPVGIYSSLNFEPVLNNLGQTIFRGSLVSTGFPDTGTAVDFTNNSGIFSESGGTLRFVVRKGDAAPGTEAGTNFESPPREPY